ncbi:hypothetical protein HJG60_007984 [Phyllostomus discolor]|uniref:Uncharacterized protein n=1 Tax=Phyllostomus discolor TaxID=89673 RepID=A0A834BL30_9CHIR|nr:hypothetical protein HJG60_007984 [Phyllostomus discolor]
MQKGPAPHVPGPGQGCHRAEGPAGERSEAWPSDQAPKHGPPVLGSPAHTASNGKRPWVFCPLESNGAHWVQRQFFSFSFFLSIVRRANAQVSHSQPLTWGSGEGRAALSGVWQAESGVGG